MDFGALPPEINSGRMYSGPGSGPLLAAGVAWDGLADELMSTAAAYGSVVTGLTAGPWLGPASASMAAAAAPYVAWLYTTAAHCEQTANQARAALAAYETAFGMTVPPPVIAANRALLMMLVATNFFGQNTPAIAATQAQYAEMWAQDAVAMYGYAAMSAAASLLKPFTSPPANTNPAGLAAQVTAVAEAASTAATHAVPTGQELLSVVPQALQSLASSASLPLSILSAVSSLTSLASPMGSSMSAFSSVSKALPARIIVSELSTAANAAGDTPFGSALAGLGRARSIGALSVPPSWARVEPALGPAAAVPLDVGEPAAAASGADSSHGVYGGLPMLRVAGRGGEDVARRVGFRPTVLPRLNDVGSRTGNR